MQNTCDSSVWEHMEAAARLYQAHGENILTISKMQRLLKRYDAAIENTQETMGKSKVADICGLCAETTGSCCFQEVETWYDPILLFINLLLTGDLPRSRHIAGQCLFLGEEGCRLRAHYSFCLNYFCPSLRAQLGPALMDTILPVVGQELAAGWELEMALYRWFEDKA